MSEWDDLFEKNVRRADLGANWKQTLSTHPELQQGKAIADRLSREITSISSLKRYNVVAEITASSTYVDITVGADPIPIQHRPMVRWSVADGLHIRGNDYSPVGVSEHEAIKYVVEALARFISLRS